MKQRIESLGNFGKFHPFRGKNLLQIGVTVDIFLLVLILEFVGLDVLPQGGDDDRSCLGVNSQKSGKPLIKLELQRLIIKQEQNCASNGHVSRPLHLKSISFLSCWSSVPLNKVIIRSIQILVQFDYKRFEKR